MANNEVFQYKQFTVCQKHAAMKVGTDADLLGTLAAGGKHILDIGTGTGIISLMMAQRFPDATIEAIDIDDNAIIDATENFANSPFASRLSLEKISFQDFLKRVQDSGFKVQALKHETLTTEPIFDCIVCNPPYFDKSTESNDLSRTRARHTSSLPFSVLIEGAYRLLKDEGVFSVCIPPEVLEEFSAECIFKGFWLKAMYKVKSIPEKEPKRYILVHKKGCPVTPDIQTYCMRNSDKSRSAWYNDLLRDFHI